MVFGTATLASGTVEVSLPFGGSYCWAYATVLSVATANVVPVGTDNVISSNAVTFTVNNASSSDDISYQVFGRMDES